MSESRKRWLVGLPVVGTTALAFLRARMAAKEIFGVVRRSLLWLVRSNEVTNFTYDLQARNLRHLQFFVSHILEVEPAEVSKYFDELMNDVELSNHISEVTASSEFGHLADRRARFGRRVAWYALVRLMKPRVVVETGVDKGLGACVLTAALMKNASDGYPGRYYGTDINPLAGYLLTGKYADYGEILYGDSISSLKNFGQQVDIFINDSDHSASYEAEEYKVIAAKLSDRSVIVGDNSHASDKLMEFSYTTRREFLFFGERPSAHWYPGGGVGFSFRKRCN